MQCFFFLDKCLFDLVISKRYFAMYSTKERLKYRSNYASNVCIYLYYLYQKYTAISLVWSKDINGLYYTARAIALPQKKTSLVQVVDIF